MASSISATPIAMTTGKTTYLGFPFLELWFLSQGYHDHLKTENQILHLFFQIILYFMSSGLGKLSKGY